MTRERNQYNATGLLADPGFTSRVHHIESNLLRHALPLAHPNTIAEAVARGRTLQARAVRDGLARAAALVRPWRCAWRALARHNREAAAFRELRRLDPRLLRDIGIERDDIAGVARGLAARDGNAGQSHLRVLRTRQLATPGAANDAGGVLAACG